MWVAFDVVSDFDTLELTSTMTLPGGLQNALEWNLAAEIATAFNASDMHMLRAERKAVNSLRKFKRVNVRVPQLDMPWDGRREFDVEVGF